MDFSKFLRVFQKDKFRRLNLILLVLFFLTFPNQNAYQAKQPESDKPLVRAIDFPSLELKDYPVNKTGVKPPLNSAKSVLVIDLPTKAIIYSQNPDCQVYPASTTKIMTALVSLESYLPQEVVTVKNSYNVGQVVGFVKGERVTIKDLLYALLVGSGNDAAEILAQNYPGGETAFIKRMNDLANQFHLDNTHFVNVSGVEDPGHRTSAHDLAILASIALQNPLLAEIVSTKKIIIADLDGNNKHVLENTNKLVGSLTGVKGLKTGWTENAGECLVAYTERSGRQILTVVLGSLDRFGETTKLIDWVFDNFSWKIIDTRNQ